MPTRINSNEAYVIDSLTNRYDSVGGSSLSYNAAGDLVKDKDSYEYEYDYENRIVKIIKDGNDIAEFAYDALGRRIEKKDLIDSNNTRRYYYNYNWQVLEEYDSQNNRKNYYVYGNYIDEVLRMGGNFYYLHDHLYSPVVLYMGASNNYAVFERYEYDAYGNCHVLEPNFADDPDGQSDFDNPYLFTGRRVDILDSGSLKIQYNRNRYYDQHTGRWLTHDPLGITPNPQQPNYFAAISQYKDGLSLYEYASSNPLGIVDPSGLSIISIIVEAIALHCTDWTDGPYMLIQVELALIRAGDYRCLPGAFTGGGNPYKHCVWSCEVAKKYGEDQARRCGRLKEDVDWAIANLADSISDSCWNNLLPDSVKSMIAAWVCSAYQRSDLRDNAAGRDCGTDQCLICKYPDCGDCCENEKNIGPRTPEGRESDGERPYSPRCRDRYQEALDPEPGPVLLGL